MSDGFTAELWSSISDIYDAILVHPFIAGLADGRLPLDSFVFYVVQDKLYLRQYARALANVAAKATDAEGTEMFAQHAVSVLAAEMQLNESLLAGLDIDPATVDAAEEAPTTLAYATYLLAATQAGSYAEGVGAVLPCYWIYKDVGKHLLGRGSPNPRYQQWIDTYGGEGFDAEAREVIAAADTLGPGLAAAERERTRRHFRLASRYEWMFWDMGYHQQSWPV
jgi:thiaminase/transcriptional activator TenA